jgi:putative heme-binding domain-containing protein
MLVYLEAPGAAAKLMTALAHAPTQEEQLEYARALRVLKTGWTPALREEYFRWYIKAGNFRGGASMAGFLRDMKKDAVATLSDEERSTLQPVLDAKPERKPPLEQLLAGRTQVREWKVDDLAPVVTKPLKGRNYDRGRALFGAVGCFACHRFDNEGGAVGPDLTGVAGRFSARDLLESVIEPSKEVSDQYAPIVVTLKNGDTHTGRIANLSQDNLSLMTDMFDPGGFTNMKRKDIQSIEPSKTSPMPEGLLNVLKEDEVLDLMAFMLSRGERSNRMFR